jgi:hypothetical protein
MVHRFFEKATFEKIGSFVVEDARKHMVVA